MSATKIYVGVDLGSTNGTLLVLPGLGPETLQPGVAVQLLPGSLIDLGDGVEGYLRANDIAKERIDDATQHLKVGDKIEATINGLGDVACSFT